MDCVFADMSDMLEDADEVNEIMGRAYGSDHTTLHCPHHHQALHPRTQCIHILTRSLTAPHCCVLLPLQSA